MLNFLQGSVLVMRGLWRPGGGLGRAHGTGASVRRLS